LGYPGVKESQNVISWLFPKREFSITYIPYQNFLKGFLLPGAFIGLLINQTSALKPSGISQ
jgi:hypothetical protein